MTTHQNHHLLAALLSVAFTAELAAQPTNFTYQGVLTEAGTPANGIYDFQFVIYNGPDFGAPGISALSTAEVDDVNVTNGLFAAQIPFEAWVLNGEQRWLAVHVRTNDSGDYTMLLPWREITPAPYAVRALNVSSNALADHGGAVILSNPANLFVGDGSGLTGVTLDGATAGDFWQLGGNAGTTAGVSFLGTTDNQPLELKVNNARALRIENTGSSVNMIGGFDGNSVGTATGGAVIAGGGVSFGENRIGTNSSYSTIGGGEANRIRDNVTGATIAGGNASGIGMGSFGGAIGGGFGNSIASNNVYSTISGGYGGGIGVGSEYRTIGGGGFNVISSNALTRRSRNQEVGADWAVWKRPFPLRLRSRAH